MSAIFQSIKVFLLRNNKRIFFKRKSKIAIGRTLSRRPKVVDTGRDFARWATQKLDKCEILGDNVPYAVLKHFSRYGA